MKTRSSYTRCTLKKLVNLAVMRGKATEFSTDTSGKARATLRNTGYTVIQRWHSLLKHIAIRVKHQSAWELGSSPLCFFVTTETKTDIILLVTAFTGDYMLLLPPFQQNSRSLFFPHCMLESTCTTSGEWEKLCCMKRDLLLCLLLW